MNEGVAQGWETLAHLDPTSVCERTGATFEVGAGVYRLDFYGQELAICPTGRTFSGDTETAELLLGRLAYFSHLSLLNYLIHAVTPQLTGTLIRSTDIKGMANYFTGSHRLPLERLAAKYARDGDVFLVQGARFGGRPVAFGDAAVQFQAFAGFAMVLILWLGDDEFPARTDLLFDDVCQKQVPIDIIWSLAMLTVLAMQM